MSLNCNTDRVSKGQIVLAEVVCSSEVGQPPHTPFMRSTPPSPTRPLCLSPFIHVWPWELKKLIQNIQNLDVKLFYMFVLTIKKLLCHNYSQASNIHLNTFNWHQILCWSRKLPISVIFSKFFDLLRFINCFGLHKPYWLAWLQPR